MTLRLWRPCLTAVLLLLTACGPSSCGDDQKTEQRVRVYASVAECEADVNEDGTRLHSDEDCAKALEQAKEAHKSSPRFSERALCEERYENCEVRREGNQDVFLPLFAGFLLGHALGNSSTIVTQPVYVNRDGDAYAGNNRIGSYRSCATRDASCGTRGVGYVYGGGRTNETGTGVWSSGSYTTQSAIAPPPPATVSRGGFGGNASSVTMPSGANASTSATTPSATTSTGVARGGFGATAATAAASSGE
jgi:uncharacterized protein YgiB involved in biofilm formation